jgi:hypothetical protein
VLELLEQLIGTPPAGPAPASRDRIADASGDELSARALGEVDAATAAGSHAAEERTMTRAVRITRSERPEIPERWRTPGCIFMRHR